MQGFLIKLITTFFFIGYIPLIPGTFGSLAGIFIYALLKNNFLVFSLCIFLFIGLGFLLCGKAAGLFSRRDPPQIIIDEICGIFVSFFALPLGQGNIYASGRTILLAGFIIFRIFDAIKPFPANYFHHRRGSLGIMGDDLVAGLYTNLVLRGIIRFLL